MTYKAIPVGKDSWIVRVGFSEWIVCSGKRSAWTSEFKENATRLTRDGVYAAIERLIWCNAHSIKNKKRIKARKDKPFFIPPWPSRK